MVQSNTTNNTSSATCMKCGGYIIPPQVWHGTIPPKMCECSSNHLSSPSQLTGWVCPICGNGKSPFTNTCDCRNQGFTTTTTF